MKTQYYNYQITGLRKKKVSQFQQEKMSKETKDHFKVPVTQKVI